MRSWRLVFSALLLVTGFAGAVTAQGVLYLGPTSGTRGWIETAPGQRREIAVGEDIPGWGRVTEITDMHLVIRRQVSQAEQERLHSQGMASYEALELRIPRADMAEPLPSPR